jgi:hypothetical protein
MRKYLLSTSALAGAALISSAAVADVSISGSFEWNYSATDNNIASKDGTIMTNGNEINIDFTNKTDSGLTLTYNVDLDADAGTTDDDNSLTIEGGFGKLVLGELDGVSDTYNINESSVIAEESDGGPVLAASATIAKDSGSKLTGNTPKVSYHLPAMGGLTAGVSFRDATVAGGDDTTEYALQYAATTDAAAITVAFTTATQEATTQDIDHQAIGVSVATGGVTFIASQATYEANNEDITTNGAGASYTLPNGLTIAAATVKSENDTTSSEYTANHYEASMAVASGLTAVVTVSDFDYENGTESSAADENGTTTKLSIKASF